MEKEAMNLKERKEGYIGGMVGRKGKWGMVFKVKEIIFKVPLFLPLP